MNTCVFPVDELCIFPLSCSSCVNFYVRKYVNILQIFFSSFILVFIRKHPADVKAGRSLSESQSQKKRCKIPANGNIRKPGCGESNRDKQIRGSTTHFNREYISSIWQTNSLHMRSVSTQGTESGAPEHAGSCSPQTEQTEQTLHLHTGSTGRVSDW